MKNFRTFDLAALFYRQCRELPLGRHAKDQLYRAAMSIANNLAEDRGRKTTPDQVRFFTISLGSLREGQAVLMLEDLTQTEAWNTLDKLSASLFRLILNAK